MQATRPDAFFDVGVATGTCDIYESFPRVPLLLVEPVPDFEPVLKELARVYGAEYLLAAASDHSGTTTLHVHTDTLDPSSLTREIEGEQVDWMAREVRTVNMQGASGVLHKGDLYGMAEHHPGRWARLRSIRIHRCAQRFCEHP